MSGMEDLLKSEQMKADGFASGLKALITGTATRDARQKLNEMNASVAKEEEKLAFANQIGQDLALRLTGAGASPDEIQAATAGLVPSASGQAANLAQSKMQKAGHDQQADQNQKQRDHEIELQRMKMEALGLGNEKKEKKHYAEVAKTFRKENKDLLDSRDKLESLKAILDKTPDRVGVEMAKTGLLKFAGEDRVSDADVIRAQRDPSKRAAIARALRLEVSGEALADDRKFYQMILQHADGLITKNLSKKVKGYSQGTAELADLDGAKLESGLRKQLNLKDDAPEPKVLVKKMYSQKANKTRLIYSDGTEQVVDGSQ
jgi:hypothetical protein